MVDQVNYSDLIGKPFKHGARGPDEFDCYGLVAEMAKRSGILVPEQMTSDLHQEIQHVIFSKIHEWEPCAPEYGAVAAIRVGRFVCHTAFMLGEDEMIHSWEKTGGVTKVSHVSATWGNRIVGFYKYKKLS